MYCILEVVNRKKQCIKNVSNGGYNKYNGQFIAS